MARVIYTLVNDGGMSRTRLSISTGMPYDRLLNYLEWMTDKELVHSDDSVVNVTSKGLDSYHRLVEWLLENVGKLNFPRK